MTFSSLPTDLQFEVHSGSLHASEMLDFGANSSALSLVEAMADRGEAQAVDRALLGMEKGEACQKYWHMQ